MADSTIALSALTAIGGVQQVTLNWSVGAMSCLPYLMLDKVQIWEAATNDRSQAALAGSILGIQYVRAGLPTNATRYYWIRPVDVSGNLGDFFPLSATAGIAATTTSVSSTPPPNSVGETELKDDAVTARKMNIGQLSAITADIGSVTAGIVTGALMRTRSGSTRVELDGQNNRFYAIGSGGTTIIDDGTVRADSSSGYAITGTTQSGSGVFGRGGSGGFGVVGQTTTGNGVQGNANTSGSFGIGVSGRGVVGVVGNSAGVGVRADLNGQSGRGAMQASKYNTFTGEHIDLIGREDEAELGDIVVDTGTVFTGAITDTVSVVARCAEASQRAVLGVLSLRGPLAIVLPPLLAKTDDLGNASLADRYSYLAAAHDGANVAALGEGQINVCGEGGDILVGDLIVTSSMPGKGMRQADDLMRSVTVARARESVRFTDAGEVRRIACIYHCG